MPEIINVHEAKTHLSRLLERANAGEDIILYKAGKPYAKLGPLTTPERKLGFIKGHVGEAFSDPLPETEIDVWEGR